MTYTIKINEVVEGEDTNDVVTVECRMNANCDTAAAEIMSDLLLSVAKRNNISTDQLNANLYKTQWINGI